jgi:hypothetical protein
VLARLDTMPALFNPATHQDVLRRLDALPTDSPRQWGKMSPAQMLEHTARALDMAAGVRQSKQALLGKLIGWTVRGKFLGPDPFSRNMPTGPDFVIRDDPDFARTKERLARLLSDFHAKGERGCDGNVHGFFGKLNGAEWGASRFKHVDHHLRQFGV